MIPATTYQWVTWKLQKNLKARGIGGTARVCLLKIADTIKSLKSGERRMLREAADYDRQFNINTSYHVPMSELESSDRSPQGYDYQPTTPWALRRILSHLKVSFDDFVFVDLGCGMGRAVFVASEFPFCKVVGVEFSAQLFRVASENVRTFRRQAAKCRDIEMVHRDASTYEVPEQNIVFYLYNPFGKEVLERVLANIERSLDTHPRRVFLVYHHPKHASLVEETRRWQMIFTGAPQPGSHGFSIYENRDSPQRL